MHKIIFSILVLLSILACEKNSDPQQDDPTQSPNILLIIADDVGLGAIPGYAEGDLKPDMPNVEWLTSQGIIFDNVWVNPVCSPTRASILTGRYGYRTGVLNVEDASTISQGEKSIQAYLDENSSTSYAHAIIGKWHLSNSVNRVNQLGIGYYAGLLSGGVTDYYSWSLTENDETNDYIGYSTTKFTDLAIDWINQQETPWFCWLAYNAPHTPFHLPPVNMHSQGDLPSDQASIDANPLPYYLAMLESIDFEIGRLFTNIPPSDLENTTIILIGDNGTPRQVIQSPYEKNQGKGSLYQGGIHVPMIVSGEGVSRMNQREDALINGTDIFPTIAEIAGINLDSYEDSFSFKSLFSSSSPGARQFSYSEALGDSPENSGFTIRNHQYKLIQFDDGSQELYDLSADPYEAVNLLINPLEENEASALQELINAALEIRN